MAPSHNGSAELDHETIRRTEDRSYTSELVGRLKRGPPDLLLVETLEHLADPRMAEPLSALLEDPSLPIETREAVSQILRNTDLLPRGSSRKHWAKGDEVEKRHAVLLMGHEDADVIEPIARDPSHPFHREAVLAMEWSFEEPRYQALKVAALSHAETAVRVAAAEVLLWDEAQIAETPLLQACDDPAPRVAETAANTLQYFPSRRVLRKLSELAEQGGALGIAAEASFEDLRAKFRYALWEAEERAKPLLQSFVDPVRDLLGMAEGEPAPPISSIWPPALRSTRVPIATCDLMRELGDLDGPWAPKKARLRGAQGESFGTDARRELTTFLTAHPDPSVRAEGSRLLASWNAVDALLGLTHDPIFHVMKSATYHLTLVPPHPEVARWARLHLQDPVAASSHGSETVVAYARHADAAEAIPLLVSLVTQDERESLRREAVYELTRLSARDAIASLLPKLEEPPAVTWAVHLALLSACTKLGLAPGALKLLREADNLDVQAAIAPFLAGESITLLH